LSPVLYRSGKDDRHRGPRRQVQGPPGSRCRPRRSHEGQGQQDPRQNSEGRRNPEARFHQAQITLPAKPPSLSTGVVFVYTEDELWIKKKRLYAKSTKACRTKCRVRRFSVTPSIPNWLSGRPSWKRLSACLTSAAPCWTPSPKPRPC